MIKIKIGILPVLVFAFCSFGLSSQEQLDHDVIARIKEEGFQNSKVMETLSYMADVYGPRLSGTPDYYEAAEWARKRLEEFGLENVHFDSYSDDLRGWQIDSYSVEMLEPRYTPMVALPAAWTKGTDGPITGVPMIVDCDNYEALQKHKGQLAGKILLSPNIRQGRGGRTGLFSDEVLQNAASHIDPNNEDGLDNSGIGPYVNRLKNTPQNGISTADKINQFLLDEGVAVVIRGSTLNHGILDAEQLPYHKKGQLKPVPHFVIAKEQHARLIRMFEKGVAPKLKVQLAATFYTEPKYHVNIIGEIKGEDPALKEQIVLVGGHFDSYHSGTGASDNGAGCATTLEALRILKKIGIKPRRTIRLAFWGGEEQGLYGSLGYIEKYVGNILEGTHKDEQSLISVYFNHDNNGHNIRGILTQGNEPIRPIFQKYLEPFHYIGAKTVVIENACCTDHRPFDAMNIPAFEWIQDPKYYFEKQLHTSMDVLDLVAEESLKQNAVIIATFVYHAAMRDKMMPRKRIN